MTLRVNEIFYSVQGESSFAGFPCVFIRLTGCNLRCSYCDTRYAYEEGRELTIEEIIDRVARHRCNLVEVTGGEPLLQQETPALINRLIELGYKVLLETNGSMDIGAVDNRCTRIVDIKCPSSGETGLNNFANFSKLNHRDEIKFVIGNREDFIYSKKVLKQINENSQVEQIRLSPVCGKLSPAVLASWILQEGLNVRLSLQLHKIIWPSETRGV